MTEKNELMDDDKKEIKAKSLVSIAIGLSVYTWDISFNFGAFGVVFLGHILAIWLFSLSIIFVANVVPGRVLPGNKWFGYFLLPLPTAWLVLRVLDDASRVGQLTDYLLLITALLSVTLCLPYIVYLFFYFTNPTALELKHKLMLKLLGFVVLIGSIAFTLGQNNYLIMTCENFIVSGQDTPKNCQSVKKVK